MTIKSREKGQTIQLKMEMKMELQFDYIDIRNFLWHLFCYHRISYQINSAQSNDAQCSKC